jgi:vacuolar-type H+-ATPase subunit E/Vma4
MTDYRRNRVRARIDETLPRRGAHHSAQADPPSTDFPDHALHVLTMAQRTADEHLQAVQAAAEGIRADALAAAEKIAREADARLGNARHEADTIISDARAAAEQMARDAQQLTDETQRTARRILSDARAQAERADAEARASAEELRQEARRRYDSVIGELHANREAYQHQIEALEQFDHEYRARLTAFMQTQLRALWVDQPQVDDDPLTTSEQQHRASAEQIAP